MPIAVVTDSTAYLPAGYAERYAVRTVPLHVSVDGAVAVGEPEFGPDDLARAFARKHRVTTAGATPQELARAFRAALDEGADGVVAVHLSRQLSGTWDAARLAAREVDPDRVRVVDSRSAAMGLGFSVLAAAEAAKAGADLDEVVRTATATAERTTTLFSVQTLEYLRRGGRIGTAAAVLGTALAIKPLLHVHDGRIDALEKVRTTTRAMSRLLEISSSAAGSGPAAIAVHHLAAPERAEQLASRIRADLGAAADCVVSEVGAVIGAHIGPGAVGVVVLPNGWRSGA
ncbi:EDD domain protein, DegV family [Saccharopolyspora antimicrobica]|uniref:DegV family protein with EDD domain n=1 Tax=Saccharopolyspora antimicrobica TaxID=455193 RepID=A0A1I4YVD1_9PSEU|nr:DegV family protein [Saccharopolyspora antimicrobica]RKT82829.1 DegV family protein with EDD domain [Saccharopolyspora antimicrobica]SFN41962.1 EDD domain protein, DegV family [Saccharopolyspora antimicrobica]